MAKVTYLFGADVTELERGMKRVEYKLGKLSNTARRFGTQMTRNITAPLVGLGALAVREAMTFENAFAKVRKSVGGTEEQLKSLQKGIIDMSREMPTAAAEIAEVAAGAGQLGIQRENILSFTKAMIQLGETSNLSAQEAGSALARFANITRMSQGDFDRLGSTVIALGNSLATTESEVVEMGLRLAGAGTQIGMSQAQVLALAGSLSSVGIEAQAGGSAFSKLMVNMKLATVTGGSTLKDFAVVAGMTGAEFKKAFEEDASNAILTFIKGLANLEGTGMSAIEVLDKMGIKEVRMRDAILRSTNAVDVFANSQKVANKAWEENIELQAKSEIFYQTTSGQIKILRNQINATSREIGNTLTPSLLVAVNKIGEMTEAFSKLKPETKTTIVNIGVMSAAIGPLLILFAKLTRGISGASEAIRMLALNLPAVSAVSAGLWVLTHTTPTRSPIGRETMEERRGLGLNTRGLSKQIADKRKEELEELKKANEDFIETEKKMAEKIKETEKKLISPELQNILDAFSGDKITKTGGAKSAAASRSPVAILVDEIRDKIEYLKEDGQSFIPILEQWQSKLKPLSEDWKLIADLQARIQDEAEYAASEEFRKQAEAARSTADAFKEVMNNLDWLNKMGIVENAEYLQHLSDIFEKMKSQLSDPSMQNWSEEMKNVFATIQSLKGSETTEAIEALKLQFDAGKITVQQYRSALEELIDKFSEFPLAVKQVENAIVALDLATKTSTKTIDTMIKEADKALSDKMIELPDAISGAFASAIAYGDDLGDTLKSLAKDIAYAIVKATILKSLFGGLDSLFGFASGGAFNLGVVQPFAKGGVVDSPAIFPFAQGIGLMGEAGPEGILPLARTSSGDLGVQTAGGGGTNITMNINAVDSQSFIQMLRNNKAAVESLVIENIYRNGSVRKAIQQGV